MLSILSITMCKSSTKMYNADLSYSAVYDIGSPGRPKSTRRVTPIKHSLQASFSRETVDKEQLNNNSYKAPNLAPV